MSSAEGRIARLAGVGAAVALGPALATRAPLGPSRFVVVALVGVASWAATQRLAPTRSGSCGAGLAVAVTALWLVPQRPDLGSALILAGFVGAGAGLVARSRTSRHGDGRSFGTGFIALTVAGVALRVLSAHPAVLLLDAAALLAVIMCAPAAHVTSAPGRRRRVEIVVSTALVVVLLGVTAFFGASTPDASWFGGGATHGTRPSRLVAITFDDGPDLVTTPQVLRILDTHGAKATFFIVGKALDAGPAEQQIVRDLVAHGEQIGNHSYHHDQWRWLDPHYPELERTQAAFARDVGMCPALYRPPHGQRTPLLEHVVSSNGMRTVLWDTSAGDWATTDPRLVARRILDHVRGGSIILLHDGLDGNPHADRRVVAEALPIILDGLRARGLEPVRLDQLLGGPATVPCPPLRS